MKSIMLLGAPPSWRIERMGQLFSERKEKVSDKDYPPLSVTMNGVVPQMEHVAKTDDSENRKRVCAGDIVINSRSDRKGASGLSNYDGSVSLISIVLEPRHGHPRFLHHLLKSGAFQEEFYRFGHGIHADLWTTRFSEMKGIYVALPDLDTQEAIADFLDRETDRIDQLIEKKQRLIEVLIEARNARISKAITVGLNNSVQLVETKSKFLPQIPMNWRIWRLKQLARVRGGLTLGRSIPETAKLRNVPYLRVANVQAGWLDLTDVAEISATESEINRFGLEDGDILMNEGGDNDKLGRGAVWRAPFSPCLNQNHVFCVRIHDKDHAEWISMATNALYARDFFYLYSNQSTNLASISKTNLERFPIPMPPKDEMQSTLRRLTGDLDRIQKLVDKTAHSIRSLSEYSSALITAAVTGQIDLKTWDKRGETDHRLEKIEEAMAAPRSPENLEARA